MQERLTFTDAVNVCKQCVDVFFFVAQLVHTRTALCCASVLHQKLKAYFFH